MVSIAQNPLQPLPSNMVGEMGSIVDVDAAGQQVAMALVEQMVSANLLAQQIITRSQDLTYTPSPSKGKESKQPFEAQKTLKPNEKQHSFTLKPSVKESLKEGHKFLPNQGGTTQQNKESSKVTTLSPPRAPQPQAMAKKGEKPISPTFIAPSQSSQSKKEPAVQKTQTRTTHPSSQVKSSSSKSSPFPPSKSKRSEQTPQGLKSASLTSSEAKETQSWRKQEDQEKGEQHKHQQEQEQQEQEEIQKVEAISSTSAASNDDSPAINPSMKAVIEYGNQESILSEFFPVRVSQFDVLLLFIEVLKLSIKSRREERISRLQERALQLKHMENVVSSYKSQGKTLLIAGIGSGVLGIASGALPIIGYMKGDSILNALSQTFTSLRGMDKNDFFKNISTMTEHMSHMQKAYGDIRGSFTQGHIHYDEKWGEFHKTNEDENSRTMEEIKDAWRGIEQFLYQALQMNHDAVRQLYGQ